MIPLSTASSPCRHGRRAAHLAIALTFLPFLTFCGGGYTRDGTGVLRYEYPPCETWPSYPTQTPLLSLRVQVLLDSSLLLPSEVTEHLDKIDTELTLASSIYATSGIALEFDPLTDATAMPEGLPTGPLDDAKTLLLDTYAGNYPTRLVLVFRRDNPVGAASSLGWNFVDVPRDDFEGKLYAHEIGHFLGLKHTFFERCATLPFATTACCDLTLPGCRKTDPVQSPAGSAPTWDLPARIRDEVVALWGPPDAWDPDVATAYARRHGYTVRDEFLDGDGLDDTPPALWATTGDVWNRDCVFTVPIPVEFAAGQQVNFDFAPCTWNPMSYYFRCTTGFMWFSLSQTNIMRGHLQNGVRRRLLP